MDLISIGEIWNDFIPGSEPYSYIRKAGGAPANVAIAAARNGLSVGFYGKVGDDEFGRFLLDTLRQDQVKPLSETPTAEAVTTMAIVSLSPEGERSFTFVRKPGADMMLSMSEIKLSDIQDTVILHAGSLSLSQGSAAQATRTAMELAHEQNKLVSFDVNYRDFIWDNDEALAVAKIREVLPFVDLLKISDEEVALFGGADAIPELMQKYDIAVIIETLGADGACCFFGGDSRKLPGKKAQVVDTTGAGDAFWGAFLASLRMQQVETVGDISMEKLINAMEYGNVAGWICVQSKGAIDSLPTKEQIRAQIR